METLWHPDFPLSPTHQYVALLGKDSLIRERFYRRLHLPHHHVFVLIPESFHNLSHEQSWCAHQIPLSTRKAVLNQGVTRNLQRCDLPYDERLSKEYLLQRTEPSPLTPLPTKLLLNQAHK